MSHIETIGFSHAEVYCKKCGRKESYNGNKPFSAPIKCSYCGGRMTDAQREKFMREFKKNLDELKEKFHKTQKNDEFTIKLLETLRDWFADDVEYTGKVIKYRIDEMINRME
jgi:hypothetical protein